MQSFGMKNICMSICLAGILLVAIGSTSVAFGDVLYSPIKQTNNGISAESVICNETLQLMIKNNDDAICVKSTTVARFTDSGFATLVDTAMDKSAIPQEDIVKYFQVPPVLELPDNASNDDSSSVETPTKMISIHRTSGYGVGDIIKFEGSGYRNQDLEVTLNDPNENEVFVEVFSIDSSGKIYFEIPTDESFIDGTYFLIAEQLSDSEITPVTIGIPSEEIQLIFEHFNHEINSAVTVEIYATPSSNVELSILDSSERTKFQGIVESGLTGYAEYIIDLQDYSTGVYSLVLTHGTEEVSEDFGVGLEIAKKPIALTLVKDSFVPDDVVLVFGTSSQNSFIELDLIAPNDDLIHEIESYTDTSGKLSSKFTIPKIALSGEWKIKATSGTITSEIIFDVTDSSTPLTLELDKNEPYTVGDILTLEGHGIDSESQISIKIMSDELIEELITYPTSDGDFSMVWKIPEDLDSGTYDIIVDDGTFVVTIDFKIN